jgi:hypothetical protein
LKRHYPPVFILSSERSGTNLLRKIINENQNVYYSPPPGHFLKHLYFKSYVFEKLENDIMFLKLINLCLDLVKIHFSPWDIILKSESIKKKYDEKYSKRSLLGLIDFLQINYAESKGRKSYLCKDNNLFDFVDSLLKFNSESKFIYLHRDPRDYVLSQIKRPLSSNNLIIHSRNWLSEQEKCLSHLSNLNNNQILKISYEEILDDENKIIRKILNFLEVNRQKNKIKSSFGTSNEWINLDKKIIRNNHGKYKSGLSKFQIRIVEKITSTVTKKLGYEMIFKNNNSLSYLDKIKVKINEKSYDLINKKNENDLWLETRNRLLKKIKSL